MNEHYSKAVTAVKTLNTKTGTLWTHLGAFIVATAYANGMPAHGTDIKPLFKEQEKAATSETKVEMGKNSTYRVQKNLLVNCVGKGISILDAHGKLKGKTELEGELAETKVEKSAIDKFKITMTTASGMADKLDARDRLVAAALVQDLLNKVTTGIALAA